MGLLKEEGVKWKEKGKKRGRDEEKRKRILRRMVVSRQRETRGKTGLVLLTKRCVGVGVLIKKISNLRLESEVPVAKGCVKM